MAVMARARQGTCPTRTCAPHSGSQNRIQGRCLWQAVSGAHRVTRLLNPA
jgi:hypothetical protein